MDDMQGGFFEVAHEKPKMKDFLNVILMQSRIVSNLMSILKITFFIIPL